jgi:hypothetical protein
MLTIQREDRLYLYIVKLIKAVMKKQVFILIAIILVSAGLSFQQAAAQEKTKEEQEKELKILKEIDQQKKAFAEQQRAQAEAKAALDEIQKKHSDEMSDIMKEVNVNIESVHSAGSVPRVYVQRGNRAYRFEDPMILTPEIENFYGPAMGNEGERTTWGFSRSVTEKTFTKDFSFEVEKTVDNVLMSVMGDCKAGDIRIKIVMPNGKVYSEIVIDEFGNLNWRKSFNISETENQDKTGEWKFQIASNKATGFFKISLQTN